MKIKSQSLLWTFLTWILGLWQSGANAETNCMCYYKTASLKGWAEVTVTNKTNYDCTLLNSAGGTDTFFMSSGNTSGGSGYSGCGYSCGYTYTGRSNCTAGGQTLGRPVGDSETSYPEVDVVVP